MSFMEFKEFEKMIDGKKKTATKKKRLPLIEWLPRTLDCILMIRWRKITTSILFKKKIA